MKTAPDAPKRPALRYYGGKWKLAPWIISFFPEHDSYVEPCGGAASVLLQKPRSKLETYNDLDGNVVNFFQVLRDMPDELIEKIRLTPWARGEYELSKNPAEDPLENARRFFVCGWMSISGMAFEMSTGWRSSSFNGQSFVPHLQQKEHTEKALYDVAERLLGVQIENRDALYIIARYVRNQETLVYFDPPYVKDTRVAKKQYSLEVEDSFHVDAAAALRECPGMVVISGYNCELYADLYENHGWERVDKNSLCNTGAINTESLWLSPRTVKALGQAKQLILI